MTPAQEKMARHLAEVVCKWTRIDENDGQVSWSNPEGWVFNPGEFDPFLDATHCEMVTEAFQGAVALFRADSTLDWICTAWPFANKELFQSKSPSRLTAVCEAIYRATGGTE